MGVQGPPGEDGLLAGQVCATDEILRWNGSAWACSSALETVTPDLIDASSASEGDVLALHVGEQLRRLDGDVRQERRQVDPLVPVDRDLLCGVRGALFEDLAREHLEDDGLFVQWVQRYGTSAEIDGIIVDTLRSEFPHVRVFRGSEHDDLFVASTQPITDGALADMQRTLELNPALRASLAEVGIDGAADLDAGGRSQWARSLPSISPSALTSSR